MMYKAILVIILRSFVRPSSINEFYEQKLNLFENIMKIY